MKIISGGLTASNRRSAVLTVLALVLCLTVLFSVAYQKGRTGAAEGTGGAEDAVGGDYIYGLLGDGALSVNGESGDSLGSTELRRNVLVLGKDYDSTRTDAIICVSIGSEGISTLQIPRDTYVTEGDYCGRINTLLPRYKTVAEKAGAEDAVATGIARLMEKIEADFGIRLHNYVFLDSAAVAELTDAVGGVTLEVPADIDFVDESRGMSLHLKEGRQTLTGEQAAQFVRYREGYPQADLGRIEAQKLYAAAMLERLTGLGSASTAARLAEILSRYVKTDLEAEEIAELAVRLCTAASDKVVMYTLPGNGVKVNGASYYGAYRGLAADIAVKGFGAPSAAALAVPDFYATSTGGYRDTEGVRLSTVLEHGLAIPVYAD